MSEKAFPNRFWSAVDARDEEAAVAAIRADVPITTSRRPLDAPPSLRLAPETPPSIALAREWNKLLETLLDAGLAPNATVTPNASSLSLLGEAVFRTNVTALDILMRRGADPHLLEGRPTSQEGLWHLLARASWISSADKVRAIADRLLEAGVALKSTTASPKDDVVLLWAHGATSGRFDPLASHTDAVLDVLMDPKYGWNWKAPRVLKALAKAPKIQAAVEVRLLSASMPVSQQSSAPRRSRV